MRLESVRPMRVGAATDIHMDARFLETNLNGMHHSYYEGLLAQAPQRGGRGETLSGEVLASLARPYHTAPLSVEELGEQTKLLADRFAGWKAGVPSPEPSLGLNKLPRVELPYKEVTIAATVAASKRKFSGSKEQQKICEETLKSYGHSAEMIRRLVTVRYSMACYESDDASAFVADASAKISDWREGQDGPPGARALESIQKQLGMAQQALQRAQTQHAHVAGLYLSLHLTLPNLMLSRIVTPTKPGDLLAPAATLLDPATAADNRRQADMVETLQTGETPKKRKQPKTLAVSQGSPLAGRGSRPTAFDSSKRKRPKNRQRTPPKGRDGSASPKAPRPKPDSTKPKPTPPRRSPSPVAPSPSGASPRASPKGQADREGKGVGHQSRKGTKSSPNHKGKAKNQKGGRR